VCHLPRGCHRGAFAYESLSVPLQPEYRLHSYRRKGVGICFAGKQKIFVFFLHADTLGKAHGMLAMRCALPCRFIYTRERGSKAGCES
jgi:hypothetical protein